MAKLEELYTKGEPGDRDCAIMCIESILESIRYFDKVSIVTPKRTCYNNKTHPNDAVYFNSRKLFIPEKIVNEVFTRESYLNVIDLLEILKNTRYAHRRIIPENFYEVLKVMTPLESENVDCLVLDYKVLRTINTALYFD